MNVKEAVTVAKRYVSDLFSEEDIRYIGLEAVEFHERQGVWDVTVGFSRPWDEPRNALVALAGDTKVGRSYKVVRIDDANQKVVSIKPFHAEN